MAIRSGVYLCLTTTPQSGIPTRTAQWAMTALEKAGLWFSVTKIGRAHV